MTKTNSRRWKNKFFRRAAGLSFALGERLMQWGGLPLIAGGVDPDPTRGGDGKPPAPAGGGAAGGQPARPAWLPEGIEKPEDLRARYDELSGKVSNLEKWSKWGDPDEFEKNLATRIAERDKQLRAQVEAELRSRAQPSASGGSDPWENYELLSPREQGQKLAELVASQLSQKFNDVIGQRWSEAQGKLGEYDQRFGLLTRMVQLLARDPSIDPSEIWKTANTIGTGDPNKLFDLAVDQTLTPKRVKKQIEDAVAAEKVKWETEEANKRASALVGSGTAATASSFRDTLNARKAGSNEPAGATPEPQRNDGAGRMEGIKGGIRHRVLEKMLTEGSIQPGQV